MKTDTKDFWIIPSVRVSELATKCKSSWLSRALDADSKHIPKTCAMVWVGFSGDLIDAFAQHFRKKADSASRLLVLNEGVSGDTLATRITNLQIRTPDRFYVAECGSGKTTHCMILLERLLAARNADDYSNRILDAQIEKGTLKVVSSEFQRLEIPLELIPQLGKASSSRTLEFDIDEHGAFLYWPNLDLHLGWEQLQQLVDPQAALRAQRKTHGFNVRYGKAVRTLREKMGLDYNDISGISEKQIRRIEAGDCRLTANAAKQLAGAHGLEPNEYLQKVAQHLKGTSEPK